MCKFLSPVLPGFFGEEKGKISETLHILARAKQDHSEQSLSSPSHLRAV